MRVSDNVIWTPAGFRTSRGMKKSCPVYLFDKIGEAQIWIPDREIYSYYRRRKKKLQKRLEKELSKEEKAE